MKVSSSEMNDLIRKALCLSFFSMYYINTIHDSMCKTELLDFPDLSNKKEIL